MDVDLIEDSLQRAAEQSTVWAVVREQDANAWIVVLEDETLLDVEYDQQQGLLLMRTELGQVSDAETRAVLNDLLVRCASAFELPRIGMSTDHRYELLASYAINNQQIDTLAHTLNEITAQAKTWREIVLRPVNLDSFKSRPTLQPDAMALKA